MEPPAAVAKEGGKVVGYPDTDRGSEEKLMHTLRAREGGVKGERGGKGEREK